MTLAGTSASAAAAAARLEKILGSGSGGDGGSDGRGAEEDVLGLTEAQKIFGTGDRASRTLP
jgi:hypothetical protein